jgi:hypothetical protein
VIREGRTIAGSRGKVCGWGGEDKGIVCFLWQWWGGHNVQN